MRFPLTSSGHWSLSRKIRRSSIAFFATNSASVLSTLLNLCPTLTANLSIAELSSLSQSAGSITPPKHCCHTTQSPRRLFIWFTYSSFGEMLTVNRATLLSLNHAPCSFTNSAMPGIIFSPYTGEPITTFLAFEWLSSNSEGLIMVAGPSTFAINSATLPVLPYLVS